MGGATPTPADEVGITAHSDDVNGGTVTYSLSNDAGGLFGIDPNTGVVFVKTGAVIDYESTGPGHSFSITVSASDGTQSTTQSFSIAVTNVAPTQPTDNDATPNIVSVNASPGDTVGVVALSSDVNGGLVTYNLTDDQGGRFDINHSTGQVFVKAGNPGFTAATTYTIEVVADDGGPGGTSTAASFNIFAANNELNVDLDLDDSTTGGSPGNSYDATFTEQSAAKPIADTDVTITNTGNPLVTDALSATVVLTNAQLGDAFTFTGAPPAGITRTVTTTAGEITVTLTGTAAYTAYQTALQQIQFSTTGDPTADAPNTTARIIDVTVTDSTGTSPAAISTISITPVNDAPVLLSNGSPATVNYTENAVAIALLANGTVADPDHPSDFSGGSYTVSITANSAPGDQIVLLGGTNFAADGTTLLHDGAAIGTLSGLGSTTVTVTGLTVAATPTVVNELAHAFGFQNSSDNPTTAPDRTVTFTFNDGGHTGGGALSNAIVVTQAVHVIAVNDAPVVTATTLASVAEDTANPPGATIGSLFAGHFSDADNGAATISGVAVSGNPANAVTEGTWEYSTNGGTNWFDVGPVSASSALALSAASELRFVPATDYNGVPPALLVHGLDNTFAGTFTSGLTTHFTDATVNGGTTPVSANEVAISTTVTEVNDAPTATNDSLANINEDSGQLVIPFATLIANDSAGPANESAQHVTITAVSNPVGGLVEIVGNDVIFTPDPDFNGPASFDYTLTDDGTTNGVSDPQSTGPGFVTFAINAVNDAPVNTVPFATQAVTENATNVAIGGISVSDVDANGGTESTTLSTSHGNLDVTAAGAANVTTNDTHSVTITGTITDINATLATLNYSADSGYTGADTLTVLTDDGGNTGSDPGLTGTATSEADTDTVAIEVSAPVTAGLTGQLWYATINGDPTANPIFSDNVVGHLNSDGSAITPTQDTGGTNEDDIALDTSSGLYFVATDNFTIESHHTSDGTIAESAPGNGTVDLSPAFGVDALAVDPIYHTLFVDYLGAGTSDTGILEVSYDPTTGDLTNTNNFLINQDTATSFGQAIDIAIDPVNRLLYYVDDDGLSTNAIYVVSYDNGTSPATTSDIAPPTPTLLSDTAQFPADGTNGAIEAVAVDDRGTATTADDIVYFLTGTSFGGVNALWYIDESGSTTATQITALPAPISGDTLTGIGAHAGLTFDAVSHQLFISDQGDSILQGQLSVDGHSITSFTHTYTTTDLTGHAPTGTPIPGQSVFDTLPVLTVADGTFTEGSAAALAGSFSVADPDLLLASVTVTVTGGFVGSGDVLTVDPTGTAITVASNTTDANGNITLVLSGRDTLADYMGVINNTLKFNSGDNPTNFGHNATRTITWHANDGAAGDPVSDGNTVTTTLTVNGADNAPVAAAGSGSGNEDHSIAGQLVATDVDNTPAQLIYDLVGLNGGALHGTVSITSDGAYIYTPNADFHGTDSFTFNATDNPGNLTSNNAIVSITVNPVNDAPVVTATTLAAVNEDATNPPGDTVGNLFSGHFSDVDNGAATIFGVAVSGNTANAGTQGTWEYSTDAGVNWFAVGAVSDATALALDANSLLRFLPASDFNGAPPALLAYGLDDTFAGGFTVGATTSLVNASVNGGTTAFSDNAVTISTTVNPVNDAPVLDLDADNSSGATGADFTVNYVSSATAVAIADGDTTITDADNTTLTSATVTLTAGALTGDVLGLSGALPIGISAVVGATSVTLSGAASLAAYQTALHEIVFANAGNHAGDRTLTVTVNDGTSDSNIATTTIHVAADNAPVAADDGNSAIAGGANATGIVTANDTDAETPSSALVITGVRTGAEAGSGTSGTVGNALVGTFGALTLNFDGSYTYQVDNSNATVQGLGSSDHVNDVFTYTVQDTAGLTDTAQITVTIAGANDPPTAVLDAVSATEAGGVANGTPGVDPSGNVTTNDTDPDIGDTKTVQGVALGTQVGPLAGNVNVGLQGAGAANFGTLTIQSDGSYTYVVNQSNAAVEALRTFGQTLTDTFSYTIHDNSNATSTTQVVVTIHGQDDNPVANADTAAATEAGGTNNGTPGTDISNFNVLTGIGAGSIADSDVDSVANGETQTVQGVETGNHPADVVVGNVGGGLTGLYGTLTLNSNGSYGYTVDQSNTTVNALNSGAHVDDVFTYTMHDTDNATSTTTLTIHVNGANDAPTGVANSYTALEGAALTENAAAGVLANDSDIDTAHANLTAVLNTGPAHASSFTLNTDGSFTYTPTAGFLGGDTFTYHVADNGSPNLSSASTTVTIDVQPNVAFIDNNYTGTISGALGSATNPFATIAAFNAANTPANHFDIVYLEYGTGTYTEADGVVLKDGQTLLGQGVDLTYTKTAGGTVTLLDADNSLIPTINTTGVGSSAVHLASNNTIAGFHVGNTTGAGITDNGGTVGTLNVSNVDINDTGQAINIGHGGVLNATFSSITSSNSTGEGITLGGTGGGNTLGGSFTVTGSTSVTDATGNAIHVLNLAAGATLSFGNTTINDTTVGGHSGNGINLLTGIASSDVFNFNSLTEKTDGGYGVATNGASVNIFGSTNTIDAHGGAALDITSASFGGTFTSVSSTNSATYGINLANHTTGTLDTGTGGTISGAATAGVHVSGGNASETIGSAITAGTAEAVDISGHSGGTIALSGAISHSGTSAIGINITNNTAGNINFTGQTSITNTTGNGVTLSNNTGATINFNDGGNGLDITTTTGAGFSATGGGTVAVQTGGGNSIHTGAGVALNIANTTIGSNNVTFHDISDNGGANGIVLNNTGSSGHLAVTGSGSVALGGDNSGGIIQNTSGAGISLTSTSGPSFNNMDITTTVGSGISGTGVTDFTFTNGKIDKSGLTSGLAVAPGAATDTSNIAFDQGQTGVTSNVSGAVTITNNQLTNAYYHGVDIWNTNGTISDLNVSGNTITSTNSSTTDHGSGIRITERPTTTSSTTLTKAELDNNTITVFNGPGIQVQGGSGNASALAGTYGASSVNDIAIDNNTISGFDTTTGRIQVEGIVALVNGKGTGHFDISSNHVSDTLGTGIEISSFGNANVSATVDNNVLDLHNVVASQGIGAGTSSAFGSVTETPTLTLDIEGNTTHNVDGNGVLVVAHDASGTVNATIKNNAIDAPLTGNREGIRVDSGNDTPSEHETVNLDISGNTTSGSGFDGGIGLLLADTPVSGTEFEYVCHQGADAFAGYRITNRGVCGREQPELRNWFRRPESRRSRRQSLRDDRQRAVAAARSVRRRAEFVEYARRNAPDPGGARFRRPVRHRSLGGGRCLGRSDRGLACHRDHRGGFVRRRDRPANVWTHRDRYRRGRIRLVRRSDAGRQRRVHPCGECRGHRSVHRSGPGSRRPHGPAHRRDARDGARPRLA